MSFLPNPIACDVCKVIKQPSNHWFYADVQAPKFSIYPWAKVADNPANDNFTHLCGAVCAVKKLSEWMGQHAGVATISTETATGIKPKD